MIRGDAATHQRPITIPPSMGCFALVPWTRNDGGVCWPPPFLTPPVPAEARKEFHPDGDPGQLLRAFRDTGLGLRPNP